MNTNIGKPTVKRLLKHFKACALALLLTFTATSKAELLFSSNGSAITITGSNPQASGVLIIPNKINNLPVTAIGQYAFYSCSGLTSVTLPSSLTSIAEMAFYNCSGLRSICFLGDAPSVGGSTFNATPGTVYFIEGKTGWGSGFGGLPTAMWTPVDGLLYQTNGSAISFLGKTPQATGGVIVPSTIKDLPVTSIGNEAFRGCTGLTSVTIPNSVTSIGDLAFYGCDRLTGVYFLGNTPTRGIGVFNGALNATVYYIQGKTGWGATFAGRPTAMMYSGNLSFSSDGTTITITNSSPKATGDLIIPSTINGLPVISIALKAFSACSGLTSVTIPNSVTSIGNNAFEWCTGLTSVTLPDSLTSIGSAAFYSCTGLTSVIIPNKIASIAASSFDGCTGLKSVTIPSSVTSIGSSAFQECNGLNSVYFLGNAPTNGYNAFFGTPNAIVYRFKGKTGWSSTFAGRPTSLWSPFNILVVQVATTLQNPIWTSVATNSVPIDGARQFYQMRASVVEVAVDLKNSIWTPVATNSFPGGAQGFYRLVAE